MKLNDPQKAREFFQAKLDFTTGPVGLSRMENVNIVDVRSKEAFAKGRVPGSVNLPFEQWETAAILFKDKVNAQCHLAAKACVHFANLGYSVMELEGGWPAWETHGMEVES